MLNIFKEKRSASSVGASFAARMPQLLLDSSDTALQTQFQGMIEKGANSHRVRPEVAAFHCFLVWLGISIARQRRKIDQAGFDGLIDAYVQSLQALSSGIEVSRSASLAYSTFWEWLLARIERYISIATTITSERESVERIIDNVCDFMCDGPPSPALKLKLLETYVLSSGRIVDILSGVRLY